MNKDIKVWLFVLVVLGIALYLMMRENQYEISSDPYHPGWVMTSIECKEGEAFCTTTENTTAYSISPILLIPTGERINVRSYGIDCPVVLAPPYFRSSEFRTIDQGMCTPYNEDLP